MASSLLKNPLTGNDLETYIAAMEAELVFLFETHEVRRDVVAAIGKLGYKTVATFSQLGETSAEVKEALKDDLGWVEDSKSEIRCEMSKHTGSGYHSLEGGSSATHR